MYTILGIIAKPMGWLMRLLYGVVGHYGIAIIIFTVVVKPVSYTHLTLPTSLSV